MSNTAHVTDRQRGQAHAPGRLTKSPATPSPVIVDMNSVEAPIDVWIAPAGGTRAGKPVSQKGHLTPHRRRLVSAVPRTSFRVECVGRPRDERYKASPDHSRHGLDLASHSGGT